MTPTPATWGPESRRAAVSLRFVARASSGEGGAAVSPAVASLLSLPGERRLKATFFVDAEIPEREAFALTMVTNAGHELGALLNPGAEPGGVLAAIEAARHSAAGATAAGPVDDAAIAELGAHPSVRYVSLPGEGISALGELVRIGFDPAAATDPDAAAADPRDGDVGQRDGDVGQRDGDVDQRDGDVERAAAGPHVWHPAMQLAVTRALQHRRHTTLSFTPAALERGDALAAFAETLDLLDGLVRAERLWVPTLGELAEWWRAHAPEPPHNTNVS